MGDEILFVQFPHPGGEHAPDADGRIGWNRGDHARKYLKSEGHAVRGEERLRGELMFWAEWEPQSQVIEQITVPTEHGPTSVWRPYFDPPAQWDGHQNTDPFVFGGFIYSICRQSARPSLRRLAPGSVILFGSRVGGDFVLDTVFVVRAGFDHTRANYRRVLQGKVSEDYFRIVLDPYYASLDVGGACGDGDALRLYVGATVDDPIEGMYSFFPCLPYRHGTRGFERPACRLAGYVDVDNWRNIKKTGIARIADMRAIWSGVVDAVLGSDLWLGIAAAMPPQAEV